MDPKGTPWCLCGAKATSMQRWSSCWQSPPAPEKVSRSGAFCTPSPPGQGTEEDHGFRQAQNTDQESRDQGWILAAGYTVRCSPSGTHVAPCFSRS